ncbi:hypothetical protein ABKV19_022097 [Rosa sericea]
MEMVDIAVIVLGIGLVGGYRQFRKKFDLVSLNKDFEEKSWRRFRRQFVPQETFIDPPNRPLTSKKTQNQSGNR